MKLNKKSAAPVAKLPAGAFPVAVIGSKGVALVSCLRNKDGEISPLSDCHGRRADFPFAKVKADGKATLCPWKGKGDAASLGKALRAWVSKAGEPVRFLPLADALKSGAVVSVEFTVGDKAQAVGYVPKGGQAQRWQYVGTEAPGFGGRFETQSLDKSAAGRADNQKFLARLAPVVKEPAKAPAKAKAPKAAKEAAAAK